MIHSIYFNRVIRMESLITNPEICNKAGTSLLINDRYEISYFCSKLILQRNNCLDIVLLSAPLHRQVQQVVLSNQLTQFQSKCKNLIFIVDYCALIFFFIVVHLLPQRLLKAAMLRTGSMLICKKSLYAIT